mgnify:CR=1 FL=1
MALAAEAGRAGRRVRNNEFIMKVEQPMKTYQILTPLLILALSLSACGNAASATAPTDEAAALEAVYTAAAATLFAQAAQATATPLPTATPTPQATASPMPTIAPVQDVIVPTSANYAVSLCDNSIYVSDVTIPDGTVLAPGESFTKTWRFQNTGTCAWSTSYSIVYVSGDAMSGSATALSAATSSGSTLDVSIEMVAPSTTGSYTGYWKLQNASGATFGEAVYVQIVVSSSVSTLTPTPTATEESSSTSTPTSTTEPTSTPEPTNTPEITATSESES